MGGEGEGRGFTYLCNDDSGIGCPRFGWGGRSRLGFGGQGRQGGGL